jgi:hypothetical protein
VLAESGVGIGSRTFAVWVTSTILGPTCFFVFKELGHACLARISVKAPAALTAVDGVVTERGSFMRCRLGVLERVRIDDDEGQVGHAERASDSGYRSALSSRAFA